MNNKTVLFSKENYRYSFIIRVLYELRIAFLVYIMFSLLFYLLTFSFITSILLLVIPLIALLFKYKENIVYIISMEVDHEKLKIKYLRYSKLYEKNIISKCLNFKKKRNQSSRNKLFILEIYCSNKLILRQFQNSIWSEKDIDRCFDWNKL